MPGANGIRIGRTTIDSELTPILLLVVVVLIYETRGVDPQARQAFAERVGMWLGPIAGAIATVGFGLVAARGTDRPLLHGTLVGVAVALLDAALTLAMGAKFIPLFAASWTGRLLAGVAAGLLAARR
jgi:hypothetical protein